MDIKRDLEFLFEIGAFRYKNRAWCQYLTPNFANITEHTYRVMWLALIIAKYEKYEDTARIVKMALVEDLAESRGVDVHYVSRAFAIRDDLGAIKSTFENTALEAEFLDLWKEVEAKQTTAAKIVKDADNIDIDLELAEQEYSNGNRIKEAFKTTREAAYKGKLYTKTGKLIWRKIQTANPFDWMSGFSTKTMKDNIAGKVK